MDIKRFKEKLIDTLCHESGDHAYAAIRVITQGMSSVRTAKLLNLAARCADRDEFYLEVGTFSGFTLLSAGYQNNTPCIGVDNFCLEGIAKPDNIDETKKSVRHILQTNLNTFSMMNVRFIESDFRNVNLLSDAKGRLAVLFIDGVHTYKEAKETLEWAKPFFANDAVVIFDDVSVGELDRCIHEYWRPGEAELLFYGVATLPDSDISIHMGKPLNDVVANGIAVMHFKKGAK